MVRFLNQFLDRMVDVLVGHGATIDKFIGDAVMATFGVPIARTPEEDARAAVAAALDMVATLEAWTEERAASGEDFALAAPTPRQLVQNDPIPLPTANPCGTKPNGRSVSP